jgi:hypothetical protein
MSESCDKDDLNRFVFKRATVLGEAEMCYALSANRLIMILHGKGTKGTRVPMSCFGRLRLSGMLYLILLPLQSAFSQDAKSVPSVTHQSQVDVGAAHVAAVNRIRTETTAFKDAQGRTLILRGVNLGGSSKIPSVTSDDPSRVSYVGRPFPLAEADEHFRRLKNWGLTTIRLIIVWEAVEHEGPGHYDQAYLNYLHQLVERGGRYGLNFIIDLHQDFYSRATGGDGAPYWTVTKLGLTPDRTNEPGAPHEQPKRGPSYWPPTAARFSVNTMDTLFWAGSDFAPGLKVDNVPVQEWLQSHYVAAIKQVALRLGDLDNVIGYDTFNEPNSGYIGVADLRAPDSFMQFVGRHAAPSALLPSYWDLIEAASGFSPEKPTVPANRLWADGTEDIWRKYGVWDVVNGKPKLERPDYFAKINGQAPDFARYVAALQRRIGTEMGKVAPGALILQEPAIGDPKNLALGLPGMVAEPHWYDGVVLMSKRYEPNVTYAVKNWPSIEEERLTGRDAIQAEYLKRVHDLMGLAHLMGGVPTLIGETGIPYDMNDKRAYKTGDFSDQETLAGLMYETLDATLASYLIWNYRADNTNPEGDHWSQEDFSIYSPDQRSNPADINSGGRTLRQVVRPYPIATAGTPCSLSFDPTSGVFEYRFSADPKVKAETVIFVPRYQYPHGYSVKVRNARYAVQRNRSRLLIMDGRGDVTVRIDSGQAR